VKPILLGCAIALGSIACKRKEPEPEAKDAYGCVRSGARDREEVYCTELDPSSSETDRTVIAQQCQTGNAVLAGRLIAHCPTDGIVAECRVNNQTTRYYKRNKWNEEVKKGAGIGCRMLGGTFTVLTPL
jgi:hypothetical protein